MSSLTREQTIGWAWIAAMVVIWTGFHLSARLGAELNLTPYDLTTLRFCVAGTLFFPWLLKNGLGGLSYWQALLLAMTAGPGFSVFAFGGYHFAPAAHGASILAGALPLFTVPLAWWLASERLSTPRILSVCLIFAGVLFLLLDATGAGSPNEWIGDVLFFVGAASWSLFGVLAGKWRVSPIRSAAIVSTFTFATFTPIHILFLPSGLLVAPWQEITIQWFYQGVIMFAGSTFGYPRAVAALGATPTSMAVALVPATVTLVAWIWLGEALSAIAIGGVSLVIAGMLAGGLKFRKSTAAPQE
jgi:drug/metabolite transporter (DMT)-like permease